MDPEYYEIYSEMLNEYMYAWRGFPFVFSGGPIHDRSLREIQQSVEKACEKQGVKLRPDAKFFLIANFQQMVAIPVTLAAGRILQNDIQKQINDDISFIISVAKEDAKGQNEISGGQILRTTAKVWDKLKTSASNIWS